MGLSKRNWNNPIFMSFLFEFLSFTASQRIYFPIEAGAEEILSSSTL